MKGERKKVKSKKSLRPYSSPFTLHPSPFYRAYAWLLDPDRPWTAVFFLYVGLLFCISGALDDWRWFAWGVMLPVIAACAVFLAISAMLIFTRFIIRLLL